MNSISPMLFVLAAYIFILILILFSGDDDDFTG